MSHSDGCRPPACSTYPVLLFCSQAYSAQAHRYGRPSGQMPCQAAAAGVHQGVDSGARQAAESRGHDQGARTHAAAAAGAAAHSAAPMAHHWHLRNDVTRELLSMHLLMSSAGPRPRIEKW